MSDSTKSNRRMKFNSLKTMVLCFCSHYSFILIHTEHLYSASSRELLRGAPDSSAAKNSHHFICFIIILCLSVLSWVQHLLVLNALCALDLSRLFFTVVLSAPHHQPSLLFRALNRHRYHFFCSCGRSFGVCMKQKF